MPTVSKYGHDEEGREGGDSPPLLPRFFFGVLGFGVGVGFRCLCVCTRHPTLNYCSPSTVILLNVPITSATTPLSIATSPLFAVVGLKLEATGTAADENT
ncbi:hypothetical protein FRB91_007305 [Serendipita sp. 411]|nr:hypothetical protein FRB91_007305 [Serendipita sp. 411]